MRGLNLRNAGFLGTATGSYSELVLDSTIFPMENGPNGSLVAIAVQSDGKILVGGSFTSYNLTAAKKIARLNTDGSIDTSFNSGIGTDYSIYTIATQSNGKILVGGSFTLYNGTTANYFIRLNTDGSIDTSFNTGTGFSSTVRTIAVQSNGKILVGGQFTSYNGTTANRIVRLNTDGSIDTSFNTGTGFSSSVEAIAVQSDGKILVSGYFTSYNGTTANYFIRLNTDGSIDTSFNTGTGFDSLAQKIVVQSDGKILVGGYFTSYNGTTANRIVRLNTDGSIDTSFNIGTGFNNRVYSIALQSDGKILVGGQFTSYNGTTAMFLVRFNTNGSIDTSFNTGTGFNASVEAIAVQSDGKILVGGSFTLYNVTAENYITRLNSNGSRDSTYITTRRAFNNVVEAIAVQSDGKILAGGWFSAYDGTTTISIVRLNTDGSIDTSFNIGTGFNNRVYSIALQSDGKILVGGSFTLYNGTTANRIVRLNTDGSIDTSFNTGTGFGFYSVSVITVQSDGKILVGGYFTSYNGTTANYFIRLNTDGSIDTSFNTGTGFSSQVYTIAVQSNGKILVGGSFTSYNGTTANYFIRLNTDGSIDTSFNTGTGFSSTVRTIAVQSDGKILIGGDFTSYNGTTANRIVRLNTDGSIDTSFNTGTGFSSSVEAIAVQSDGKVLVGGSFTSYNGTTSAGLVRLKSNGVRDTRKADPGFESMGFVYTIAISPPDKILVGGDFTVYNTFRSRYIAALINKETS